MAEIKSILFNTEMVRATLENRKTATRRVVKPQHLRVLDSPYHKEHPETPCEVLLKRLCEPPCRPGDILYVRETWAESADGYVYRADNPDSDGWGWRPSIHMPREAARIFLRVTGVRVERLRDITEEQAQAEGLYKGWQLTERSSPAVTAKQAFMWVWDMTVKSPKRSLYGWMGNPWVWVIEFQRINREEAGL